MSLEQKIDELIVTLRENSSVNRELVAAILNVGQLPAAEAPVPGNEQVAPAKAVKANPTPQKPKPVSEQEPAGEVSFEAVKKGVLKLNATEGRQAVVDFLARFGLTTLKDAKPDQYAEMLAALS